MTTESSSGHHNFKGILDKLKQVQRGAAELVRKPSHTRNYSKILECLAWRMIDIFKYLNGCHKEKNSVAPEERNRSSRLKPQGGRFRIDMWKNFQAIKTICHKNSL